LKRRPGWRRARPRLRSPSEGRTAVRLAPDTAGFAAGVRLRRTRGGPGAGVPWSLAGHHGDVREGKFSDVSGRSDMLHVMAQELQPVSGALTTAVAGEIVDPAGLAARAAEVAARQRSPETRRTYAAVYRTFCAFLGPDAPAEDLRFQ